MRLQNEARRQKMLASQPPMPTPAPAPVEVETPALTVIEGGAPPSSEADANGAELVREQPADPATSSSPVHIQILPRRRGARTGVKQIRWDYQETHAIADQLAGLMRKQGLVSIPSKGDHFGRSMLSDMLATAQLNATAKQQLPGNRQRLRAQPSMFKASFWSEVEKCLKNPAQPAPVQSSTTNPGEDAPPSEASAPAAQSSEPASSSIDLLATIPTAALLSAVFSRMLGLVGEHETNSRRVQAVEELVLSIPDEIAHLRQDIMQRLAAHDNAVQVQVETRKVLPRVAIIGCQRYEFDHIQQGAKGAGLQLDFRHYDQDSHPRPVHAEWVISMKWISHDWARQINSMPTDHKKFISGGVGTVINQLKQWFTPA